MYVLIILAYEDHYRKYW